MFGNLKKKFNSAIQEGFIISESLQQQYFQRVSPSSTPRMEGSGGTSTGSSLNLSSNEFGIPNGVNMAAGCNLLAKFEDDWKLIHEANDENGQKADGVARKIDVLYQRSNAQRMAMSDLISCLSGVPALVAKLNASMEVLKEVRELSESAERKLEQLEDVCDEYDFQEFMLQKQYELSQYKQAKMVELELYRQKLATEHQEKIRQHEERWQHMQRERQAVFDDAFRGDLEEYKRRGSISKVEQKVITNEVSLEEVILEDRETKYALEEFLNG